MSHFNLDLATALAQIRQQAVTLAAASWPQLGEMLDSLLPEPMDPFALIPVATGTACGATIEELLPLAAGIVLAAYSLRIVDDCADEDDPDSLHLSIGAGRAINAALALSTIASQALFALPFPAPLPTPVAAERKARLLDEYHQAFLRCCAGQDQDMRGLARSLLEYTAVVQAKTVTAFEFAALAGAVIATDDAETIESCQSCGMHLGWMIQMLDDIEALWFPDGPSDLSQGRLTFPVLYGLTLDHPAVSLLRTLCSRKVYDTAAICAVLDQMEVRRRLMSHALDHRDAALTDLAALQPQGRAILQLWLDWFFRNGERLLGK